MDSTSRRERYWKVNRVEIHCILMAGSDALVGLVGDSDEWLRVDTKNGFIEGEIETQEGEVRALKLEFKRGEGVSKFVHQSHGDCKSNCVNVRDSLYPNCRTESWKHTWTKT